jgi:hypothetical protein
MSKITDSWDNEIFNFLGCIKIPGAPVPCIANHRTTSCILASLATDGECSSTWLKFESTLQREEKSSWRAGLLLF